MGGQEKPTIPDPMTVSREELDLNRFDQSTPWGSQTWDGDRLTTELNPHDARNLGMRRDLQSGILSAALGGDGAGKPPGAGAELPPMGGPAEVSGLPPPAPGLPPAASPPPGAPYDPFDPRNA